MADNFAYSGALVVETISATGYYQITTVGGSGGSAAGQGYSPTAPGDGTFNSTASGGAGALVQGTFYLHQGDTLDIVVGGAGGDGMPGVDASGDYQDATSGGGGGGSFVILHTGTSYTLLAAAGGGGGAGFQVVGNNNHAIAGNDAQASTDGGAGDQDAFQEYPANAGGTGGSGGGGTEESGFGGSGGGGFASDGQVGGGFIPGLGFDNGSTPPGDNGEPPLSGGAGDHGGAGGFGGGAGGGDRNGESGGGGGGYSGGGGGNGGGAGGGGSYDGGSDQTIQASFNPSGDGSVVIAAVACYAGGTLIATERGEVAIETLAIGDRLVTASGASRPVRWIGWRHLDTTRHPDPRAVWPVRVSAGAFGQGLPRRDLRMSPGHNVFVDGVLMPVRLLINGATVVQEPVATVDYWHVELDNHDVILAEGLAAESYLDTGNRSAFADGDGPLELHPDFEPKHWAETCAPIVKSGPAVEAAKVVLLARAAELGHATTPAHDLHAVADGCRIAPVALGPRRFAFLLPEGGGSLHLASDTFVPAHADSRRSDTRQLGVCVRRLEIDGVAVDLRTLAPAGWHAVEDRAGQSKRWTTGRTALPAGARLVLLDLGTDGRYWARPAEAAEARDAA